MRLHMELQDGTVIDMPVKSRRSALTYLRWWVFDCTDGRNEVVHAQIAPSD